MSAAAEKKLDALIELMTRRLPGSASPAQASQLPPVVASGDEEAMYQRFKVRLLAEVPAIAAGGPVTVMPPEKLRKDFQRQEADRMIAAARSLRPLAKRVLKLLETTGGEHVGQRTIAERLGRAASGNSWTDLGKAIKELEGAGFAEVKDKVGVRRSTRETIAKRLDFYKPTEPEIDSTYQTVLFQLATENGGD